MYGLMLEVIARAVVGEDLDQSRNEIKRGEHFI